MLSINTNLSSLIAQSSLKESTNLLNRAVERMTTGYKINGAKDNAANYSISTNMTTKINSYMVAEDNAAMGLDMVTTASSTLDLVSDHVQRIRDLCEQAANGTYGEESLKAIQAEIDSRQQEIDRIISQAEYNGIKFLESEASEGGVTGKFLAPVTQLTEEEAIAEGYTIIKTADELQAMEDNLSGKYILMNDIDLAGYDWDPVGDSNNMIPFEGELNGNGYIIKNLRVDKSTEDYVGLFSYTTGASIKNLGIEDANVVGRSVIGGVVSYGASSIENCYITGIVKGATWVGGLLGMGSVNCTNFYADVVIEASSDGGAIVGSCPPYTTMNNVYYNSTKSSSSRGIAKTVAELNALIIPPITVAGDKTINLQIGTMGDSNSQISFVSSIALDSLGVTVSDSDTARGYLTTIDDYLAKISAKQVEYGAVTNRLESALAEISTQYENLVSSRSTLRDADIAKESSTYIQQQILQQASSTLLATANQSPSIALQLI